MARNIVPMQEVMIGEMRTLIREAACRVLDVVDGFLDQAEREGRFGRDAISEIQRFRF